MKAKWQKWMISAFVFAGFIAGGGPAIASTIPASAVASPSRRTGPQIQFDSTVLNIGKIAGGQIIKHTFVFTNTGDQVLEIKDVRPTCGCTVAGRWDKRVEPGKTGMIPVQYTSTYEDEVISKTVVVDCNVDGQTNIILQIKGVIWEPVNVVPAFVMFGASSDCRTNVTRVVNIVNNLDEPLTLSKPQTGNDIIQPSVKTIRPGKEFELQLTLSPPLKPGTLTVPVTIKTSSTNLPTINITAYVAVQPPILAVPSQITLKPGPLVSNTVFTVAIQNNGAGPMALSDPTINVPGVSVDLKNVQPGRHAVLSAIFPAGFEISSAQNIEVRMNTGNRQFPVVTVPVIQNRSLAAVLDASGRQ